MAFGCVAELCEIPCRAARQAISSMLHPAAAQQLSIIPSPCHAPLRHAQAVRQYIVSENQEFLQKISATMSDTSARSCSTCSPTITARSYWPGVYASLTKCFFLPLHGAPCRGIANANAMAYTGSGNAPSPPEAYRPEWPRATSTEQPQTGAAVW